MILSYTIGKYTFVVKQIVDVESALNVLVASGRHQAKIRYIMRTAITVQVKRAEMAPFISNVIIIPV
jgi:hypothetical protein